MSSIDSYFFKDLYLSVFSYLTPIELIKASTVSKRWKKLSQDSILWHKHYAAEWALPLSPCSNPCWLEQYRHRFKIEKEWKKSTQSNLTVTDVLSVIQEKNWVVFAHRTGHVQVFNVADRKLIHEFDSVKSPLFIACSQNLLVLGNDPGVMQVWDLERADLVYEIAYPGRMNQLAFNSLYLVAVGFDDHKIMVWDMHAKKIKNILQGHACMVNHLLLVDHYLISAALDDELNIWDLQTGACFYSFSKKEINRLCSLTINQDYLVLGSIDGWIKTWEWKKKKQFFAFRGHSSHIKCLRLEGDRLLTGSDDKTVKLWKIGADVPLLTLNGHQDEVTFITMNSDKIGVASKNGTIKIWNRLTGSLINTLENGHKRRMDYLSLTETQVVSQCCEGIAKIWNFTLILSDGLDNRDGIIRRLFKQAMDCFLVNL